MKNQNKKVNPNRVGLIFSIGVCVLSLGIGAFSYSNRSEKLYEKNAVTTKNVVEIRKNQENVQKGSTTSSTTTTTITESTTLSTVATKFSMPVKGDILKEYSDDKLIYSDTFCDWRLHGGVDIAAKIGANISSAGAGVVKEVCTDDMLGTVVAIDHGNGIIAYYCGLDDTKVKQGDTVKMGEKIGTLGNIPCESADESHLHLYVEKQGETADPFKTLGINHKKNS